MKGVDIEKICKLVYDLCKCVENGPHEVKKRTPDATTEKGTAPMDILHGDMKGPLSKGPSKYYLTFMDTFSGKHFAQPMPDATAASVKKGLIRLFSEQGYPRKIKFDNGRNFIDRSVKEFLKTRFIEVEYGCVDNPSGQTVERRFRDF